HIMIFLCLLSPLGCFKILKEISSPEQALVRVKYIYPDFIDDMDIDSLALAVNRNLEYLNSLDPEYIFTYGPEKFTCSQVRESQVDFLKLILSAPDAKTLKQEIKKNFILYRAAGSTGNRKVLFTGYYEPVFDASIKEEGPFKYPIYRMPDDLIKIDLSLFNKKYKGQTITAMLEDNKVIPYYSRKQIEEEKALTEKGLEIAWLKDPLDVAFLHIQGSGRLRLQGRDTIPVGYMAANGHPYNSIGKYMIEKGWLSSEEMSMQAIRAYLSAHPELVNDVLDYNPSYVFFRVLDKNSPLGNIQVPLTGGRSIATDSSLFPKGALGFISCEKPVLNSRGEIEGWTEFSRFVVNQDTGGAIKGAGRADIFWGNGQYAELAAGHMKHQGKLYIIIKKP
ncbi:MAG: MltA domain-containing protein, partial [Deltaproteobacteria bacterium]|nr:MltA domain-containing protein [Deltaproteobacteria bacterium]